MTNERADGPDVIEVAKDECLFEFESASNDIFGVFESVLVDLFKLQVLFEQELFVVGQLNDERAVKDVLEPLCENEGNCVADVHAVARRPTACIQIERLPFLVPVQDLIEFSASQGKKSTRKVREENEPVREEGTTPQETMGPPSGQLLETLEQSSVYSFRSKLVNELVVVDGDLFAFDGGTLDVPGSDNLVSRGGRLLAHVNLGLAVVLSFRFDVKAYAFRLSTGHVRVSKTDEHGVTMERVRTEEWVSMRRLLSRLHA